MRVSRSTGPVVAIIVAAAIGGGGYLYVRPAQSDSPSGVERAAGFCEAHQVPERICPFCHPDLIDTLGFCEEHGVPEALCTRCNPAVIPAFKSVNDWCGEHGLPESQCTICNPRLTGGRSGDAGGDTANPTIQRVPSDTVPRSRRVPVVTCATNDARVRLRSPDVAASIGLEFVEVRRRPITETIQCNAEVAYDGNRYVRVSSPVPGRLRAVRVVLGQEVKAGDVLLVVDSAELAAAKAEYLQSMAALELWERNDARERNLLRRGVSTEKDAMEAETRLVEVRISLSRAEQRLRSLGLVEKSIADIGENSDTSPLLPIASPLAGVVVERSAVVGESVVTTTALVAVADTSDMWAVLDLMEGDLGHVRPGQPVVLTVDGLRGETFGGRVTWIASEVDTRTRTIKVWAQIDNADGLLRANMFGRARIAVHDEEAVLVVPKAAVQWEGCCNIVFVRHSDTLFEPRKVRLGSATENHYEVLEGLAAAESVVTQGSYLLKTEILKGSIGAGCCEVEHLEK